jgi:hypothetical protein
LPRDAYFAIADEARKRGIPFVGHVPISVTVAEASDAGQKSIEHLTGVVRGCSAQGEASSLLTGRGAVLLQVLFRLRPVGRARWQKAERFLLGGGRLARVSGLVMGFGNQFEIFEILTLFPLGCELRVLERHGGIALVRGLHMQQCIGVFAVQPGSGSLALGQTTINLQCLCRRPASLLPFADVCESASKLNPGVGGHVLHHHIVRVGFPERNEQIPGPLKAFDLSVKGAQLVFVVGSRLGEVGSVLNQPQPLWSK